jgi:hypothetical protein
MSVLWYLLGEGKPQNMPTGFSVLIWTQMKVSPEDEV